MPPLPFPTSYTACVPRYESASLPKLVVGFKPPPPVHPAFRSAMLRLHREVHAAATKGAA